MTVQASEVRQPHMSLDLLKRFHLASSRMLNPFGVLANNDRGRSRTVLKHKFRQERALSQRIAEKLVTPVVERAQPVANVVDLHDVFIRHGF